MPTRQTASWVTFLCLLAFVLPHTASAQSLSSALGATKLDGLKNLTDCQNQALAYREHLIADRIEARLAQSPALNEKERAVWMADVQALRAVTPANPKFTPADPKDSQHYFLGLTDKEQQAINSMGTRHTQEINLECEKKYGGMTRYSPGSDQSGQKRYEEELRAKMVTPIDIATIPVTALPSPFPKTPEQVAAERKAQRESQRQAQNQAVNAAVQPMIAKMQKCQEEGKGLRLSIMADHMQKNFDASTGLSAKDRAEYQADIKSVRDAAAQGLNMPAPIDPGNPMRAMMRLPNDEQMAVATEYSQKFTAQLMACQAR